MKGKKHKPLNNNEVMSLLQYRETFGRAVRQRSVRSDSTKSSAGTLPIYMYTKVSQAEIPAVHLGLPIHNHRLQNGTTANPIGNATNALDDTPKANTHGVDAQVADVADVRKLDALQLAEDVRAPEVDVLAHQIRADHYAEDSSDDHVDSIIILDKNLKHIAVKTYDSWNTYMYNLRGR